LHATVRELALGLIALGVEPGDRVCILANTRPEWSYADFAATSVGAVVVPIYQTNSPEECAWVAGKLGRPRDRLRGRRPARQDRGGARSAAGASDTDRDRPGDDGDAISLAQLRERGAGSGLGDELDKRIAAVKADDPYTFIYTSGTTGPPKGCVLTHGNYRDTLSSVRGSGAARRRDDVSYLPLAHSFALLIQLLTLDMGGVLAYWSGDPKQIVPELAEVKARLLPVGAADLREDSTTLATAAVPAEQREQFDKAIELGFDVRTKPGARRASAGRADERLRGRRRAHLRRRPRAVRRPATPGCDRAGADRSRESCASSTPAGSGTRGLRDDRDSDGLHVLHA